MSGFYHLRGDTLAGLRTSAIFLPRSLATQPLPLAVAQVNKYMNGGAGHASPEGEAFKFYYANHVFSVIAQKYDQNEPLPDEVLELARGYVKLGSDLIVRLAYYILLITTREMRHLKDYGSQSGVLGKISEKYGDEVSKFIGNLCSHGEDGAEGKLRKNPPNVSLGQYVGGISVGFHKGQWSAAFGGPKWGVVTDTLADMVSGKISPEMFADIGFTLAHNGGPIFNKGMLYTHWDHILYKILDCQRAGMIPQLYEEVGSHINLDPATKQYIQMARKVFPDELKGHVDYYKVEALGALKKYVHEKAAQNQKHGASPMASAIEKQEANKYYVSPHEAVQIVQREETDEELEAA